MSEGPHGEPPLSDGRTHQRKERSSDFVRAAWIIVAVLLSFPTVFVVLLGPGIVSVADDFGRPRWAVGLALGTFPALFVLALVQSIRLGKRPKG